jgi:hypothetical protein
MDDGASRADPCSACKNPFYKIIAPVPKGPGALFFLAFSGHDIGPGANAENTVYSQYIALTH